MHNKEVVSQIRPLDESQLNELAQLREPENLVTFYYLILKINILKFL